MESANARLSNIQKHLNPQPCSSNHSQGKGGLIKISPEVSDALFLAAAVVALESTIICHGMPYPQKLETAKEIEGIVRENGAVPATIAILDGIPHIGLDIEELEWLAKFGAQIRKTARRDIAAVVPYFSNASLDIQTYTDSDDDSFLHFVQSQFLSHNFSRLLQEPNGATTVSATMFFASMVGISVFVTGGIGGVHRHGEQTMDVSSDLIELGKNPFAVVSAGAKSILDIPRTLEYLVTHGVCVAGYRTNEFPAFFTETSGCKVPCRLNSPQDAARLIEANMKLELGTGILIAVPIPKEHSASGTFVESAIQRALKEAREKNITGSAETPFLLSRVNELTGGASLASNIALVKNNAIIGSKIAVRLAQLGGYGGDDKS
ncbi:pseudouridine-5'-phosphate glycosidase-like [Silene latifolia]|uniref:pseudouridine-5'-phosphate glycosidase-like n=1 Tax=Silene latifolia TaxID=37657 RepID=UPI003D76F8ED